MSFEITTAFTSQFSSNILHLSQQKRSRFFDKCSVEPVVGEQAYFNQIIAGAAQEVFDRHGDSPIISSTHNRRRVAPRQFEWGEMVDTFDNVKTLTDPRNPYTQAGSMSCGRAIDDIFIDAAIGTAKTGKDGGTDTVLPTTQKETTATDLTTAKLRTGRKIFLSNEVDLDDPMNKLYCAIGSEQIDALLTDTNYIDADFNSIKALVNGDTNTWLGYEFVQSERLTVSGGVRSCIAWVKSGVKLGVNKNMTVEIAKRPGQKVQLVRLYLSFNRLHAYGRRESRSA